MKKNIFLVLFIFELFNINNLCAQIDYSSLIDTSVLSKLEIKNLSSINTSNLEFSPMFYDNGLVFVSSNPVGKKKFDNEIGEAYFTLRFAEIDSLGDIVKNNIFAPELKIKNHLGPCAFDETEDKLFLSRNKKGTIKKNGEDKDVRPFGIYIYKYKDGYWVFDDELPLNSTGYNIFHPTWDAVNSRLIFASDMPGGYGKTDLYSIKYVNGKWIELTNLGSSVNSGDKEAFPFIYNSKYLFFATDAEGGKGGFDMYFSQEVDGKFITPVNLGDKFNTEYDDFGLVLNSDATKGYFSSSRVGGKGKDDIYMFESDQSPFGVFNNFFTLNIVDSKSQQPIDKAQITFSKFKLLAENSPKIAKIKGVEKEIIYSIDQKSLVESQPIYTGKNGMQKTKLPAGSYILKVLKTGYLPYSRILNTEKSNRLVKIELAKNIKDKFEFSFLDANSKSKIKDVQIQIENGDDENELTKVDDLYMLNLARGNQAKLIVNADGYQEKIVYFEYGKVPAKFDILLDKKQKYVEYLPTAKGEVMVLKDIYYKYNSDKLTSKAKKELNKLIKHLNSHPNMVIELSSYTDCRGRSAYNQKLSDRRSSSAKRYLVRKGIKSNRIIAKGYGETQLRNHCSDGVKCSDKEHAINRRTEVKVIEK